MIYVNGDSYSRTEGKNYGDYLSEIMNLNLLHKGIPGSSNSRIFRTSTRDLLKLKHQGVEQCYAVIDLSFWFRTELWIEDHGIQKWYQFEFDDGEFASFQAAENLDWFEKGPKVNATAPSFYKEYLKQWVKTTYADSAIINTIYQASLLKNLCENLGYKLMIFWGADVVEDISRIDPKLDALKEFYEEFNDSNSFNLLQYSFSNHYNAIREPYDFKLYGRCGHPNTLSHKEFAGEINDRLTRY